MTRATAIAALEPLFGAMRELVPGLPAAVGPAAPGAIAPGADNREALDRLVAGVRRAHPSAGRLFWGIRSWSLIEWQPAALAVFGVHVAGLVPQLDHVAMTLGDGSRVGFSLPTAEAEGGPRAALIAMAGIRLRRIADTLLADLDTVIPVKRRLAERLLADRVLGLLAILGARHPDLSARDALAFSDAWLAALSLEGASRLVPLTLSTGRELPVLDRRSCCLEYRAAGGICCMTCPRLAPAEREARIRRHWETEGGSHAAAL